MIKATTKRKTKSKTKVETEPELRPFKLPPRIHISKEEFLRRLRSIRERRKQHLAQLRKQGPF